LCAENAQFEEFTNRCCRFHPRTTQSSARTKFGLSPQHFPFVVIPSRPHPPHPCRRRCRQNDRLPGGRGLAAASPSSGLAQAMSLAAPINLLFITTYVGLGGGETALLTLVEHLDPARFRPHLLLPYEGQLSERWRANGWPVHIFPWRGATVYFLPPVWARFPIARQIEQIIRQNDIQAVHSD